MSQLRFLTAGESHGKCLIAVLEGMVAGLKLDPARLDHEMARRQMGHGRGGRMLIEKDRLEILSGVRHDETIGGPVAIRIENKDFKINELPAVHRPRPGHADLPGALKYDRRDIRDILERSSARETAARVAVGTVCRLFLENLGVRIASHVIGVGGEVSAKNDVSFEEIFSKSDSDPVRCLDAEASARMVRLIDKIQKEKDTIGGLFEVRASGVVPGVGSFVQADRKLDAALAQAILSIQAVKGVEFGLGFGLGRMKGAESHDEIFYDRAKKRFFRKTNRAGGVEGGMSNGEEVVLRAVLKPLATPMKPLKSVNLRTKEPDLGTIERSDVTPVAAAAVVAESAVAFVLARAYLDKFGGDSMKEVRRNYEGYSGQLEGF